MKVKQIVKKGIVSILPEGVKYEINRKRTEFAKCSYGQHGEDLVLDTIFRNQPLGFYVDIGAHHPQKYSNTYRFYQKGWRGINIDAMPGSMDLFNKMRPEDINLEIPISDKQEDLSYFIYKRPALNTFSEELVNQRAQKDLLFSKKIQLKTQKLSLILEEFLPKDQEKIDFFSVDVEGLDLAVLQSNDWDKFRPGLILVEIDLFSLEELVENEIYIFLTQKNYSLHSKLYNTVIFVER